MMNTLQTAGIAGTAGLVLGLAIGAWGTHEFYAPRLALAENQVQTLGDRVDEQNTAIEGLNKAAKARAAAAKKAVDEARAEAAREFDESLRILTLQPPPGIDRCAAASALVRQELAK